MNGVLALRRAVCALGALGALAALTTSGNAAAPVAVSRSALVLVTDADDDDDDGVRDSSEAVIDTVSAADIHWFNTSELPRSDASASVSSPVARWVVGAKGVGQRAAWSGVTPRVGLQGVEPGRAEAVLGTKVIELDVIEFAAFDAQGTRVDEARSHASISRSLPAFLSEGEAFADTDALRWVVRGPAQALPERIDLVSRRPDGSELDHLLGVELRPQPCPSGTASGLACRTSPPIRATADPIDRGHPESAGRSLRAEVGGKLLVHTLGRKVSSIRVGGPRISSLGPIERYRARLRVHVMRSSPGGPPAIGDTLDQALSLARREVDAASAIWGQCGIHFGLAKEVPVELVDPPPAHLVAIGCELGLPASGGEVRFRVGKKQFRLVTAFGDTPGLVAVRLAAALEAAGYTVTLSRNPRIESGALETVDLSVRFKKQLVAVERDAEAPLSSDPSLDVCIGSVELADGLRHFGNHNAPAGTLEERTLIKAYADADPNTIEVFVVPAFSSQGRVGESFIDGDSAAIQNTVLVDRLAVRSGARSHVLSHELGHILLDMPGHPDDFGVDRPSALMDADATDPTIFGPRRLSVAECERAIRQRGPSSRAPLLAAWPLIRKR